MLGLSFLLFSLNFKYEMLVVKIAINFSCVGNHVKLGICSFVMNFNSGGVSSKGTVLCGGYWLWA